VGEGNRPARIAVLGAGALGTALSMCIARNRYNVKLWVRRQRLCNQILKLRENPEYCPGVKLPRSIHPTKRLEECLDGAGIIFFAVPSFAIRDVARKTAKLLNGGAIVLSTAKGVEYPPFKRMSEVLAAELPYATIAVMSGPNFATELLRGSPSVTVLASEKTRSLNLVRQMVGSDSLAVRISDDVVGVETGGIMKGILTIAIGVAYGMGFGDNTMGLLFGQGFREMSDICRYLGGKMETIGGESGLGDWVASAFSQKSRNRALGQMLGMGLRSQVASKVAKEGVVAEGTKSVAAIHDLANEGKIRVPLTDFVYRILFNNEWPTNSFVQLLEQLKH